MQRAGCKVKWGCTIRKKRRKDKKGGKKKRKEVRGLKSVKKKKNRKDLDITPGQRAFSFASAAASDASTDKLTV
jgi:hypothetical protein